jgi:hypothetical protein
MVALLVFAWDALSADRRWRLGLRWAAIGVMLACLVVLLWLHPHMEALLPPNPKGEFVDYDAFHRLHLVYLWTITVQWAASVAFMGMSIMAWRAQDRFAGQFEET